ncbi:MAG: hypothetical protein JO019_04950 [Candidatus Kaiserbacteria bacterium]|nr:hypothetical protein [Candidatus Kaiserbacteria bacterium]
MAKKKKAPASQKKSADALCWYFPTTDHGENDGFADSQLEYFQGDHERFIAREAIQNAVDARLDYDTPVTVVFEKLSVPTSTIPGHEELASRMSRCLAFVKGQEKAEIFFKAAISLLKGKTIPILKISDFNTKGLFGSDDDVNGNWYRLVKAAGTSSPKGVKGGSFGIGKGAPIAASALRTVFYSSINDKNELVFQGKARLVSHHDDERDVRRGIGFYGINGYNAVRKSSLVPQMFKREERGTDIFVLGYKSGGDWEHKLIRSVLDNFWLAIHHGTLEVIVRDGSDIRITKDTLRKCLEEYDAQDARCFYEAVTNPSSTFEEELKHLGKVTLWVRKDDSYPGRVMMARKPKMVVQEKAYRVLREPYAGVMICDNDRGNELLRDLEPPQHDKWDKDRAATGPVALRELDIFMKKSLKSMGDSLTSEPQDIPGLDRYLPDSEDRDYLPSNLGEAYEETGLSSSEESGREIGADKDAENGEIETVIRKSVVTNKQQGAVTPTPPEGPGKGPRGRATGPEGEGKEGARISTSSISFRSFAQSSKKGLEYLLAITGREDCEGAIRLVAVGDDGSYPIEIESATDVKSGERYEIGDSLIKGLVIESGKAVKIVVRLSSSRKYTLGIENYEG